MIIFVKIFKHTCKKTDLFLLQYTNTTESHNGFYQKPKKKTR